MLEGRTWYPAPPAARDRLEQLRQAAWVELPESYYRLLSFSDGGEGPLPILVTFTPLGDDRPAPGQAEGWANEWVTLRSNLAAIDFKTPPADEPDDMPPSGARDKKTKEKGNKGRGKKKSR